MRIVADENIGLTIVQALRDRGCDVIRFAEVGPGRPDGDVLAFAVAEGRSILTYDRDYGELIFNRRADPPLAILYLRIDPSESAEAIDRLAALLDEDGIEGHLIVVESDKFRRRALPPRLVKD